jgi:ribose transport system ATP-binding protein
VNLVCADRVGESIVAGLSVRENFFLNPQAAGRSSSGWLSPAQERAAAKRLGETVGLRPNDPDLAIELLSGGNQQKVAVGRWLNLKSKIYIFEDPTAGVDVGSKAEIYKLFDVALKEGAAILIVSTDFEEVSKVCHRALVFSRGQVVRELHSEDLSISNLLSAASASVARDGVTAAGAIH